MPGVRPFPTEGTDTGVGQIFGQAATPLLTSETLTVS